MPSGLCSVISRLAVKLIPTRITAALLLGRYVSQALRERLAAAISKVDPAAWRARLRAVLSADVAVHVSSIRVPVLYRARRKIELSRPARLSLLLDCCRA